MVAFVLAFGSGISALLTSVVKIREQFVYLKEYWRRGENQSKFSTKHFFSAGLNIYS
jgi:hypothetical protein